jgi:hypothetical protein
VTEPEYIEPKPGESVVLYAGLESVAVRVEHLVRPGQAAFCRVSGVGQLGMFRADDDGGNAIEVGVFVEPPAMVTLLTTAGAPTADDVAWMVVRTIAKEL